ncbi:hypothetical protein RvY_02623 [Ramazzottius varieornatus]|uniref:Uncharacterized protein n=1 Tax=Ramazzottius varieornatus TaxID=947166 RepID=A0A1D1UKC8_RAMVA|nr:hypothetical protein RvY_02623 [Ramazzottius varieornatus]
MNRLLKSIRKTFIGGGGRRGAAVTTTTTTLPTTEASGFNLASLNLGNLGMDGGSGGSGSGGKGFDPAAILAQLGLRGLPPGGATSNAVAPSGEGRAKGGSLLETSGSQNFKTAAVPFNPADLLGQLSISFEKSQTKTGGQSSGDVTSQFLGMLPMLLSVAKPVMAGYKGTAQYGDFMTMLQDAKQLFSNREVIRQINQFLDELITGDDTQTPPTPSDSSLTSLAQLAQNMESLFNVPQARPKTSAASTSYSRKTAGLGKTVPEDGDDAVNDIPESADSSQTDREDSALQSDGS